MCLALPEAGREIHAQHARFHVRNRTFAYFLNDHHGDGIVAVTCKVDRADVPAFLERARGMPRSTPVAVAESVSSPQQKFFAGQLGELPELAARCTGGPALLLIGEVFRQAPENIEVLDLIARTASHRA